MNILKPLKVVLLVLMLWLPAYTVGFMFMIASMSMIDFDVLWKLHLFTMATTVVVTTVTLIHLFKTPRLDSGKKALWGITLFCAAPIALPIYFFAHMWPEATPMPERA